MKCVLITSYVEFPIQLDTGSSDIWVMPPFPLQLTNTTDIPASLTFGIGEVNGTIAFANMSFGPYEVPNQGDPLTRFAPNMLF